MSEMVHCNWSVSENREMNYVPWLLQKEKLVKKPCLMALSGVYVLCTVMF